MRIYGGEMFFNDLQIANETNEGERKYNSLKQSVTDLI